MMEREFEGQARIGQLNIPVRDQARAVAFYRDLLGIRFRFEVPNLAIFDCGGIRLLLDVPEGKVPEHRGSILHFRVGDLEASTDALRARGVKITSEPHRIAGMPDHDLWTSLFEDSEGNILALMAEVPHAD
jgi:methylmalonyl-CoA/ethylmalonyl-CoA epimerase